MALVTTPLGNLSDVTHALHADYDLENREEGEQRSWFNRA